MADQEIKERILSKIDKNLSTINEDLSKDKSLDTQVNELVPQNNEVTTEDNEFIPMFPGDTPDTSTDPNIKEFRQRQRKTRTDFSMDSMANDFRKYVAGKIPEGGSPTGGMPYRVQTLEGGYETDTKALSDDLSGVAEDFKKYVTGIIDSRKDDSKDDKEKTKDALSAFTETVELGPELALVAREAVVNIVTKDIPFFLGWMAKGLAAGVADVKYIAILKNTWSIIGNTVLDIEKSFSGKNVAHRKADLEDLTLKTYGESNIPLYQHLDRIDKELGISEYLSEVNKNLLEGMQVREEDRNIFHHMVRYGIEIGSPVFGIPFLAALKGISKSAKFLDDHAITQTLGKYASKYKGREKELELLADSIRKSMNAGDNVVRKGKFTTTIRLPDGTLHRMFKHNRKRAAKEWGAWRNLNMIGGAAVGGGATHSFIQSLGPEYKAYLPVAYLGSIAGAIKGLSGMTKTVTRTPGLLAPFGDGALAMGALGTIGFTRTAGNYIAKHTGQWINVIKQNRGDLDWIDSTWGKFFQAQAAGVSISRTLGDIYRNNGAGLNKLIAENEMSSDAYKHLNKMYNKMSPAEQKQVNASVEAAVGLAKRMSEMTGGVKGFEEHFFMLDQVINLSVIRSQRQILMNSVKFGKEGFLSKFSGWGRGIQIEAHLDKYNRIVEQQTGAMALALKNLRKTKSAGTQGHQERIRLANMMDDFVQKSSNETRVFKNQLIEFKKQSEAFTGKFEKGMFRNVVRKTQAEGGLIDEAYNFSRFRDDVITKTEDQHKLVDGDTLSKLQADSNQIIANALDAAHRRSQGLYAKIGAGTKFENVYINMNNVVDILNDEVIKNNPTVYKMSGLEAGELPTLKKFITYTKENYLNRLNFDDLEAITGRIKNNAAEALDEGEDLVFTFKGNKIDVDQIDSIIENASEQGAVGGGPDALIDFLKNLGSETDEGKELVKTFVPSVLQLSDLKRIRSNLGKQGTPVDPTNSNIKTFKATQKSDAFDKAYDLDGTDEIGKTILEKQGLSSADITEYLRLKKEADDNFRDTIGYLWKADLGRKLSHNPLLGINQNSPQENMLHFFSAATDMKTKETIPYGIEAFNRAFPKTGKSKVAVGTDVDGSEIIETIENSVLRERAVKMLIHQLGHKMIRDVDDGIKFARGIKPELIEQFISAKIIPPEIGNNLVKALEDLQSYAVKDQEIIGTLARLDENLKTLPQLQETSLQQSWISNIIKKDGNLDQKELAESLIYGVGRGEGLTRASTEAIQKETLEGVETVSSRVTEATGQTVESAERTKNAIANLKVAESVRDENVTLFLNAVKEGKDPVKSMSMIDDTVDVMLNHIYNESFRFGRMRSAFGLAGKKKLRDLSKGGEDSFKFFRLRMDVHPDDLANTTDVAIPAIRKLYQGKLDIAMKTGDGKLIAEAQASFDKIDKLKDISSFAVVAKGEVAELGVAGQPTDFQTTQVISRVYSWARGVVGPQYLATEAAYKAWHVGHANLLKEILFNETAVDALHRISKNQGKLQLPEVKVLMGLVVKAFSRGHGYANAQEKKIGDQMLSARLREEYLEDAAISLNKFFGWSGIDPERSKQDAFAPPIFKTGKRPENLRDRYIPIEDRNWEQYEGDTGPISKVTRYAEKEKLLGLGEDSPKRKPARPDYY